MISQIRFVCAAIAILLLVSGFVNAGKYNRVVSIGDTAPAWNDLPGVDGKDHSWADHKQAKAVAVIFTSNDCPVAMAYQQRINKLATDYQNEGLAVVAINVNSGENIVAMKSRADAEKFAFEYVYDESQESARKLGAVCTPHAFLLTKDRAIAYMGAIDDNWQDPNGVTKDYLKDAIRSVLEGQTPDVQESRQLGCAIKWKGR